MPLPGDELIEAPVVASTHATDINTTPTQIWPWLVQIGQDRGGFYSYTVFENLMGCKMKNASTINPQWQSLKAGDPVAIHPKFKPLLVNAIEPSSHLVLRQQSPNFEWTWTFFISQVNPDSSRLIVRTRLHANGKALVVMYPVMTVGHYFMERKMLLGIKRRSEYSSTKQK